jgi:hypothetical protein
VLQSAEINGSTISGSFSFNLTGLGQTFEGDAGSRTALLRTEVSAPAPAFCKQSCD